MLKWIFRGIILITGTYFTFEGALHLGLATAGSESWAYEIIPEQRRPESIDSAQHYVRGGIGVAFGVVALLAVCFPRRFYVPYGWMLTVGVAIAAATELIPETISGDRQAAELIVPAIPFILGILIFLKVGMPPAADQNSAST